jgi:putative hydrolase of the HAD superfamily
MAAGTRERAEALLLDLDGVLRVFDPSVASGVEQRYGLPPGAMAKTAFEWSRLRPAIVGEHSHTEWMGQVAVSHRPRRVGGPGRGGGRRMAKYRGEIVSAC